MLVEMITRKARDLSEISEDFCQRSSHYKIKTFYEELPLKGAKNVIVDKMDAHMFIDNEVPKGVHADHLGMVQFEDGDDETFLHVCQYISEAVGEGEEMHVSVPPPPYAPPLAHPLPLMSLEEWAAREKMLKEMARVMGALDNGRAVKITPSPTRRPAIMAGQQARKPMPWETEEMEEKVAIPVGRPPRRIWEPESDDEEEVVRVHAPVSPPLRQPLLLWSQENEEKATAATVPVFIAPALVPQQIQRWGGEKQDEGEGTRSPWATDACVSDEEVEDDLSEEGEDIHLNNKQASITLTAIAMGEPELEAGIYLDGKKTPVTVTVTAVAIDEPTSRDEEIPAQHPESRKPANNKIPTTTTRAVEGQELEPDNMKGVPAGEHGRISGWLFSKMWHSLGRA